MTTPTNPQPAKIPRPAYPDFRGPEQDTNYGIALDKYCDALECALAEREAEVANANEELRKWQLIEGNLQEPCKRLTDQLRAAEERAERAEKSETALSELNRVGDREIQEALSYLGEFVGNDSWTQAVQRMSLTLLSVSRDCNVLRRRLATVADEIERTHAITAFESFPAATAPVGSRDGWVIYSDWEKHANACRRAQTALTALVAKLRENKL